MLEDGDILKFVVWQGAPTNPTLNVFHYRVIDAGAPTTTYAEVAQAFWDYIKTEWRATFPLDIGPWFRRVVVENVTNGLDFGEYTIPTSEDDGTRTTSGDYLGDWLAVAMRLNVGTHLTRPGQKRFGGLYEGDQASGFITSTLRGLYETFGGKLDENIGFGLLTDGEMQPVVYGEVNDERPEPVYNPVTSVTVQDRFTSQRTRRQ